MDANKNFSIFFSPCKMRDEKFLRLARVSPHSRTHIIQLIFLAFAALAFLARDDGIASKSRGKNRGKFRSFARAKCTSHHLSLSLSMHIQYSVQYMYFNKRGRRMKKGSKSRPNPPEIISPKANLHSRRRREKCLKSLITNLGQSILNGGNK